MSFFSKLFSNDSQQFVNKTGPLVAKINELEPQIKVLSDTELSAQTAKFRDRLKQGETLDDLLPAVFGTGREVAWRTLKMRHFNVQLVGGIALHSGQISEMKTGEGKTLVATLPAYLNALGGDGVHIVTVNDYLARRDAVWMGQIYAFLGLTVGVINNQTSYLYDPTHTEKDVLRDETGSFHVLYEFLRPCSRREAYAADITYGTNNEFGFDYLRDNVAYRPADVVQRMLPGDNRFNFAIIDEVDSILIDEARTPLIISAPVAQSESLYGTFAQIARQLEPDKDFTVDEKMKAISLTDDGITRAETLLGVSDIYSEKGIKYVHHLETAVRAQALFELDRDYVVKDGEIIIVDEFTGRLQPGRRWSEGLHQAIEAKESVEVKEESRTFATITLQNYFRLYRKLAGMTGTAMTSNEEFLKVYTLPVVEIPTNKLSRRADKPDLVFQTENGKFIAIAKKVKELFDKGQPVLVGTVSIEKNELLSAYLKKAGVPHNILNAKNHEQEGQIIAGAGKLGGVVIATNMAGRGVDIKLGGPTPTEDEHQAICDLGGLFVLGTERHEARRIDNQLRGRSGRQGDPGETQFFVSLEDTLMRVFASGAVKNLMGKLGIAEDEPIESRLVSKTIAGAQTKIEGYNFDLRKHLLEYDDVTNHQRLSIYDKRRKILFDDRPAIEEFLQKALGIITNEDEKKRLLDLIANKKAELSVETFWQNVRSIILQVIDMYWVEHLEAIEYMRNSVRLRAYGQRDPLVEFKREGLHLFKEMELAVNNSVLHLVENMAAGTGVKAEDQVALQEVKEGADIITAERHSNPSEKKIGRNDPCPCGSGKKWKKCGMLNIPEHRQLTESRG